MVNAPKELSDNAMLGAQSKYGELAAVGSNIIVVRFEPKVANYDDYSGIRQAKLGLNEGAKIPSMNTLNLDMCGSGTLDHPEPASSVKV